MVRMKTSFSRRLTLAATVAAACLVWLSIQDAGVSVTRGEAKRHSAESGFSSAAESSLGTAERAVISSAASQVSIDSQVSLQVMVVSAADHLPLAGMQATLLRSDPNAGAVPAADPESTDANGQAVISVVPGRYAVVVNDPSGKWVMDGGGRLPTVTDVPGPSLVVGMVPRFEALFTFVGDSARSVGIGPSPLFRIDDSLQVNGQRTMGLTIDHGVYRFALLPLQADIPRDAAIKIDVIGEKVGECSFSVPASMVGLRSEPLACDMRLTRANPLAPVAINVVDVQGNRVDVSVGLYVPTRIAEQGASWTSLTVPAGYQYAAILGSPFPIRWDCSDPAVRAGLDLRGWTAGQVTIPVTLPVAIAHKNMSVMLDGKVMPNPGTTMVCVKGVWGRSGCRGTGDQSVSLAEALRSRIPLPIGRVLFEFEGRTTIWKKQVEIGEGTELTIELLTSEGVPR